jgi:hypothetical protein
MIKNNNCFFSIKSLEIQGLLITRKIVFIFLRVYCNRMNREENISEGQRLHDKGVRDSMIKFIKYRCTTYDADGDIMNDYKAYLAENKKDLLNDFINKTPASQHYEAHEWYENKTNKTNKTNNRFKIKKELDIFFR